MSLYIELPDDLATFTRGRAAAEGIAVEELVRGLIDDFRREDEEVDAIIAQHDPATLRAHLNEGAAQAARGETVTSDVAEARLKARIDSHRKQ